MKDVHTWTATSYFPRASCMPELLEELSDLHKSKLVVHTHQQHGIAQTSSMSQQVETIRKGL
jgi:hypothetical protein